MTKEQLAKELNGIQYRGITNYYCALAKENGLVIVYGQSDDLCELRGAVEDEESCYDGGDLYVNEKGFAEENCGGHRLSAVWCPEGQDVSWAYATDIPHATFHMMDGEDELYCIGLVCDVADFASKRRCCPHCGRELPE
jgi:hypothetical protein